MPAGVSCVKFIYQLQYPACLGVGGMPSSLWELESKRLDVCSSLSAHNLHGRVYISICEDVCLQAKIAKLAAGGPGAQAGSSAQAWELENMRERLYCQVCMRLSHTPLFGTWTTRMVYIPVRRPRLGCDAVSALALWIGPSQWG